MPHFDERTIGDLTVRIDRSLCVGFGDCITLAPQIFDLDDEGIAAFLDTLVEVDRKRLLEACDACPVDAIVVLDPAGRQLVP